MVALAEHGQGGGGGVLQLGGKDLEGWQAKGTAKLQCGRGQ
jgi:hypothetical protein